MALSLNDHKVQRVLDWLLTPPIEREPSTKKALAEMLGLNYSTITRWQQDPDFLTEWDRRYKMTVASPERMKSILDTLLETAVDRTDPRHVHASKAYAEITNQMAPKKVDVTVHDARDLSDEKLFELLGQRAAAELETRSAEANG